MPIKYLSTYIDDEIIDVEVDYDYYPAEYNLSPIYPDVEAYVEINNLVDVDTGLPIEISTLSHNDRVGIEEQLFDD